MLLLTFVATLAVHNNIESSHAFLMPSFGRWRTSSHKQHRQWLTRTVLLSSVDEIADVGSRPNDDSIDSATMEERKLLENAFKQGKKSLTDRDVDDPPDTMGPGFVEHYDDDEEQPGEVLLPRSGVSVEEVIDASQQDEFPTVLVPVNTLRGVGQIVTDPTHKSFEHVRYLVALTPPPTPEEDTEEAEEEVEDVVATIPYVLIDIPPYSDDLVASMQKFMGKSGYLSAIMMTSKDGIHYNEAPGTFTIRNNDIAKWHVAFPDVLFCGYRLDTPRKSREFFTQILDGYGPWALDESQPTNLTFVETGHPLEEDIWDPETLDAYLDEIEKEDYVEPVLPDDHEYSPASIRKREEGKRILALYAPGHTYGSMCYVFPEMDLIVSGYTIPVEENDPENPFGQRAPLLDARGYISTVTGSLIRQMQSAKHVIETYGDRFSVILPSRTDPLFLGDFPEKMRKRMLLELMDQYEEIGMIYKRLGINDEDMDDDDDDFNDDEDEDDETTSSELHP